MPCRGIGKPALPRVWTTISPSPSTSRNLSKHSVASTPVWVERGDRMSDSGAIDPGTYAALSESVGGDQAFLAELIHAYLAEAPGLIATMRQTLASMDMDAFRRAAHSLKSSSATF